MSKLKEAILKANEIELDPNVEEKRRESLDNTIKALQKQASDVKRGIDQYRSMNRKARRIKSNKMQYEYAISLGRVILQRLEMFEQAKSELK